MDQPNLEKLEHSITPAKITIKEPTTKKKDQCEGSMMIGTRQQFTSTTSDDSLTDHTLSLKKQKKSIAEHKTTKEKVAITYLRSCVWATELLFCCEEMTLKMERAKEEAREEAEKVFLAERSALAEWEAGLKTELENVGKQLEAAKEKEKKDEAKL